MLIYKCKIDKDSKETLIITVVSLEEMLPTISWTGFMKNYTDWDLTSQKMNENKDLKCSIYVHKKQLIAYVVSNFAFPIDEKLRFAHLGGLIA